MSATNWIGRGQIAGSDGPREPAYTIMALIIIAIVIISIIYIILL